MDESTRNILCAVEEAVSRLVEACRKESNLYPHDPRAAAQVSRTGKWLLNAITALRKSLDKSNAGGDKQAG